MTYSKTILILIVVIEPLAPLLLPVENHVRRTENEAGAHFELVEIGEDRMHERDDRESLSETHTVRENAACAGLRRLVSRNSYRSTRRGGSRGGRFRLDSPMLIIRFTALYRNCTAA